MLWWVLVAYAVVSPAVAVLIGSAIRVRDRSERRATAEKRTQSAPCPALVTAREPVAVGAGR